MDTTHSIDRRAALRRVALLLGGAVSAPTLAGILAGCEAPKGGAAAGGAWTPQALSSPQGELVATLADHILPRTETPGARDAGVHQFIDEMLAKHYPAAEKTRFLAGLEGVDVRARGKHQKAFVELTAEQQHGILAEMDRDAYPAKGAVAQAEKAQQPPPRDAMVGPSAGPGTGALAQQTYGDAAAEVAEPVRNELKSGWFWKRMKELTLTGYYTSQVGATQELKTNPMGAWRADVAYPTVGHAWA